MPRKSTDNKSKLARKNLAIDVVIGYNLRRLRQLRNLSQENLAEKLGVTFQQIQKYENGKNRVALSTAYKISIILECSVVDFFLGIEHTGYEDLQNLDGRKVIKQVTDILCGVTE